MSNHKRYAILVGVSDYADNISGLPYAKNDAIRLRSLLLIVCRYVQRNALRANPVQHVEDWPWSSLWQRQRSQHAVALSDWPVQRPPDWLQWVNEPQSQTELEALRHSVKRSSPFREPAWQQQVAIRMGLEATLRPQGRPRNAPEVLNT